jgi:hypothetical protein
MLNEYQQDNLLFQVSKPQLDEWYASDKGFTVLTRPHPVFPGKRQKVNAFASGSVGSYIRDATTGMYFAHRVGSKDEDLFFKVRMATGECKNARGSNLFFYESPYDCIKHLSGEQISQEVIEAWLEKKARWEKAAAASTPPPPP